MPPTWSPAPATTANARATARRRRSTRPSRPRRASCPTVRSPPVPPPDCGRHWPGRLIAPAGRPVGYNGAVSPYLFGHDWAQERRRLALLEQIYDGGTRALLSRLPLPADAQCLEVGAGAGSIALWLCDQVGDGGRVVGTDLDVEFLSERAAGTTS